VKSVASFAKPRLPSSPSKLKGSPPVGACRNGPIAVNFNRHRTLEQGHRDDKPISLLRIQKYSLDTGEGSLFDANPLPNLKEGPGSRLESGNYDGLQRGNFTFFDRNRRLPRTDYLADALRNQNGQPILRVKAAKQIAWE